MLPAHAGAWGLTLLAMAAASALRPDDSAGAVRPGSLSLSVRGLPAGTPPVGTLRGPGTRRQVRSSRLVLTRLRPGRYTLSLSKTRVRRASGAIRRGATATPQRRRVSIRIRPGRRTRSTVLYSSIVNSVSTVRPSTVRELIGPAGDPTAVVLSGRRGPRLGSFVSIASGGEVARGVLSKVTSVSRRSDTVLVGLRAISVFEVAPVFEFDERISGARGSTVRARACGGVSGLEPYRTIKNVRFAGGWNTQRVLRQDIKVGVRLQVDLDAEVGVTVTRGLGLDCSLKPSVSVSGMAGPIPVTAAIEGEVSASAAVGASLSAGGSVHISAKASTVGVPPLLVWVPSMSLDSPKFTLSGSAFLEARASVGIAVKAGLGNDNVVSATLKFGSTVRFSARPGGCSWDADFGQFSAQGKIVGFTVETPKTPALFSKNLWSNPCGKTQTVSGEQPDFGGGPGNGGGGGPVVSDSPWQLVGSPAPSLSALNDVWCWTSSDCIAVGALNNAPLAVRRTGGSWTQMPVPTLPEADLRGVACSGPDACTAVGRVLVGGVPAAYALRWDGQAWISQAIPLPDGAADVSVRAVSCPTATACIAVGAYNGGSTVGAGTPFAARWDGTDWTLISPPIPDGATSGVLIGISCSAADACTAAGYRGIGGFVPFATRWDGAAWTPQFPSIPAAGNEAYFTDVSCPTSMSCTAVGRYFDTLTTRERMMAQRWDGSTWSDQPISHPAGSDIALLEEVSCPSPDSCTAVGLSAEQNATHLLAQVWNGSTWTAETMPDPPAGAAGILLRGVSCATSARCAAVGYRLGTENLPLAFTK